MINSIGDDLEECCMFEKYDTEDPKVIDMLMEISLQGSEILRTDALQHILFALDGGLLLAKLAKHRRALLLNLASKQWERSFLAALILESISNNFISRFRSNPRTFSSHWI